MHLPRLSQFHRLPGFLRAFAAYRSAAAALGARLPRLGDTRAMVEDATATTGFDSQYVYHCGWAARELARMKPERHVDISSALWFVSTASAICPIDHYDYRPPALDMPNVTVGASDLLNLPFADASVPSLSCMHVIEHVGLGRYGDALDPLGDRKAMAQLQRVLAPGGALLFVTPVGKPRVVFNAHRIYAYEEITAAFPELEVESFALITDGRHGAKLVFNADPAQVAEQKYGCGCWVFRKPRKAAA
ncbi:MAG: putative SAM-dependent methyltransferase [Hyphomicrobiales bacterium]|nr:putative SAM-dependent methyltransferase [Hyphomicrobiales bacterium]